MFLVPPLVGSFACDPNAPRGLNYGLIHLMARCTITARSIVMVTVGKANYQSRWCYLGMLPMRRMAIEFGGRIGRLILGGSLAQKLVF
jgi:hypothetical protein